MIIPLTIDGKGPYNFVLDTGVGLMLISDSTLVDSVNVKNLRSINISGFGDGQPLSAYVCPSLEVRIGNAVATNLTAAILKQDVFELSSYVGMPVHGLIGYEFFNSFIVRIDFSQNILTVYRPSAAFIPRKGYRVPIAIEERKPYVNAEIQSVEGDHNPVKLIIDTGAGHPISLENLNGLPFQVPKKNIPANLGVGLTGPISGYIARIESLKLGRFSMKNVLSAFPDHEDVGAKVLAVPRNGNLGITVLKRFVVVFDYSRSALYLKPAPLLKTPFEHDMSGMELAASGDKYQRLFITRIEPGSAADMLGLMKEDELISINFKPVAEMGMNEIDELFRSRSDRNFILDIIPFGSTQKERVVLTLRRRI